MCVNAFINKKHFRYMDEEKKDQEIAPGFPERRVRTAVEALETIVHQFTSAPSAIVSVARAFLKKVCHNLPTRATTASPHHIT